MTHNNYAGYNDLLEKEGVAALIDTLRSDYENDYLYFNGYLHVTQQEWISNTMNAIHNVFPDTFKDLKIANDLDEFFPFVCPVVGSFKAYKKILVDLSDNTCSRPLMAAIAMLTIPSEAKRSSAFSRKCRASMAFVDDIVTIEPVEPVEHFISGYSYIWNSNIWIGRSEPEPLAYFVGKNVYPDYFDDDRWNECSHGIHFFMTKEEAIVY